MKNEMDEWMNEWESSQTSNRLELMMKKTSDTHKLFSLSLFLSSLSPLFFSLCRSLLMKRVSHATIVSRRWLTSAVRVFFSFFSSNQRFSILGRRRRGQNSLSRPSVDQWESSWTWTNPRTTRSDKNFVTSRFFSALIDDEQHSFAEENRSSSTDGHCLCGCASFVFIVSAEERISESIMFSVNNLLWRQHHD